MVNVNTATMKGCRGEILPWKTNSGYVAAERQNWPPAHTAGDRMETLLLAALQAGVTGSGELVLELLDAASRIDELQFARVKGMANAADIDLQLFARATRRELVAAAARNLRREVFGMDA